MTRAQRILIRAVALIWALPTTLVGSFLLGLAVASGGRASLVDGVLEAHGGRVRRLLTWMPLGEGGVAAVTFGHIVLGTDPTALALTRAHERAHVAQCERWGPLFHPAYAIASLWALLGGASSYRDNRFEREAFRVANPGDEDLARMAGRRVSARST